MKLKIKKKTLVIVILGLYLLFKHALEANSTSIVNLIVSYSDEALTIMATGYVLYAMMSYKKVPKFAKSALASWGVLLLIGVVSTLFNMVQPLKSDVIDMIACSKFFAFYVATGIYWNNHFQQDILLEFNCIVRFIVTVLSLLVICNVLIYPLFPSSEFRLFINSQQLFFGHPSNLADSALFCFIILLINEDKIDKTNTLYMILASLLIVSTMRDKQISAMVFGWISYLYFYKFKFNSKFCLVVIGLVASIYIGYDSLSLYYGGNLDATARGAMTSTGFQIAKEKFPLGYGFASFGSGASIAPYSKLYYQYKISTIYGLTPLEPNFANDAFWPIVFGQFGWSGFIVVAFFFWSLLNQCFKIKENRLMFCGTLVLIAYLIIATVGTTSIFNDSFMLCAAILSYAFVYRYHCDNENQNVR